MNFTFRKLAGTFLLLQLLGGVAIADPLLEDSDWLKTMAFAAHQTNYSGVFVYQSGGRVETSRITHISDKDGEHERLEGLDGLRREVIRNNDSVWLYVGGKKVRVEKRRSQRTFPALLPEQIQSLKDNYQISQGEEDRVADYHAHTLIFQPKDKLRYTRKMWAHSQSGLLLKAVVQDEHGNIIEEYSFSQLTIGDKDIDRKWIKQEQSLPNPKSIDQPNVVAKLVMPNFWQVDFLPPGFKKVLEINRTLADKKNSVVHMVYSDGLSGISVFIEKSADAKNVTGLSGRGAIHMYNRLSGDNLITVVGEVPPRVVIQVADSVRFAGE